MHRKKLLDLLNTYIPRDHADAQQCDSIRDFVAAHSDCFERSLLCGHVTGSAWLVNAGKDSVLLTHHRKLDRWMQLGGHADGDSDILRVALKEAAEESGIEGIVALRPSIFDLDVHEIPARGEVPAHYHYDLRFALLAPAGCLLKVSEESHEIAWVALDEIEKLTREASILRMRDKWIESSCP